MPRVDDYRKALEIGKSELRERNPLYICRVSGAEFIGKNNELKSIALLFLNRRITISWPDLSFSQESGKDLHIKEEILILHYLNNSKKDPLTGEMVTYKEIPSARFYEDAFNRRVKHPLVSAFGENPEKLREEAGRLFGAQITSLGDVSVIIQAFPKVPVTLVIWRGDDEFSPDGTILFDSSIKNNLLSAEDISELVSMIVYPLVARAR